MPGAGWDPAGIWCSNSFEGKRIRERWKAGSGRPRGWHISGLPRRRPRGHRVRAGSRAFRRSSMPAQALFSVTLSAITLASGTSPSSGGR